MSVTAGALLYGGLALLVLRPLRRVTRSMERFAADLERLFGFTPTARRNAHAGSAVPPLSPLGLANLTRVLASEYETLNELAILARHAGVPMAIEYRPAS